MLPTVAPGQVPGVLRIASSVLHILSQTAAAPNLGTTEALMRGRKAAQERFSEESFWLAISTHQKRISQTSSVSSVDFRGTHNLTASLD